MAPPKTLTTLPNEVLLRICKLLSDSHFSSLRALSQANRHCFSVAAAALVDTITFYIGDPAQLAQDVENCKQVLQQRNHNLFSHVRRLIIVGCMGELDSRQINPLHPEYANRSWHLSLP
ncbi:uncharacterized protein QC763_207700 [Podospora pseudopauciseta]|nr:hypothetical protein QC763_207700 [Podospora pseudopauciseta]